MEEKNKEKAKMNKLLNRVLLYNGIIILFLIIGFLFLTYTNNIRSKVILNGKELSENSMRFFKNFDGATYVSIEDLITQPFMKMYKLNNGAFKTPNPVPGAFYIDTYYEAVNLDPKKEEYTKFIKPEYLDRQLDNDAKLLRNEKEKEGEEIKKREEDQMDKTIFGQEHFKLSKSIKIENNKKYVSLEDARYLFNMDFKQSADKKIIYMYTINYLESLIANKLNTSNYTLSNNYQNRRAIIDDLAVVALNGKELGINQVDRNTLTVNKNLIPTQYDDLRYAQNTKTAYAIKDKKVALMSIKDGKAIIPLGDYSTLAIYSEEKQVYLVSRNKKYGLIGSNGNQIIPIEFDKIGYDLTFYPDEQKNSSIDGKILFTRLVPVMKNEKWGLYTIDGNREKVVDAVYKDLGYKKLQLLHGNTSYNQEITIPEEIRKSFELNNIKIPNTVSTQKAMELGYTIDSNLVNKEGESTLTVPDETGFGGVVVRTEEGKYGIVSSKVEPGIFALPANYDRIYKISNNGQNKYYAEITARNETIELTPAIRRVTSQATSTQVQQPQATSNVQNNSREQAQAEQNTQNQSENTTPVVNNSNQGNTQPTINTEVQPTTNNQVVPNIQPEVVSPSNTETNNDQVTINSNGPIN